MPINNPVLKTLINNNTVDQLLAHEDVAPDVADLEEVAKALFEKYNEEVRNDPVRQQEHALQNYTVTVNNKQEVRQVRAISYNGKVMRFTTASRGQKPASGYPLYISLHGGGDGPPATNDEQWLNQMGLWKDAVRLGLYVTPRAIADSADEHFKPESYVMYDRIIENMIAFEGVDPNKVYVLGFSAGGDGVYQLTAEMSDRFAATNMMAGHPNGVSIRNYRNVPFLIQMGENDTAFDRNKEAARYHEKLNQAAAAEGGYVHDTFIHPNGDHNSWMGASYSATPQPHPVIADPVKWLYENNRATVDENTDSILWLRVFKREPYPQRVSWNVKTRARSRTGIANNGARFWKSDARARQFYWLDLGADSTQYGDVDASFDAANNSISISQCGGYLRVLINHRMLDLTKPVHVLIGADHWLVSPRLSLRSMVQTLVDRGDIHYIYPAAIEVRKTATGDYVVAGGVKLADPAKAPFLNDAALHLMDQFPDQLGIWNFGVNNSLSGDWLLATPFNAFGTRYDDFKQAMAGDYPLFELSSGNATQPNQQSVPVLATQTKPGDVPAKLLEGHSYWLYDEMYSVITSASAFVDITTLTPPTGRFLAALTDALTYISNKPEDQRPIVRILYSNWTADSADLSDFLRDPQALLSEILRGVDPAKKLEVYAGAVNAGPDKGVGAWATSWNHARIVAADGNSALVGGHDLWSDQYLDRNPVFDVSMKLQGESAKHAQDYADRLWRYVLWRMNASLFDRLQRDADLSPCVRTAAYLYDAASRTSAIQATGQPDSDIYVRAQVKFAPPSGTSPILSIGRNAGSDGSNVYPNRGSYISGAGESADEAIYWLLSRAQSHIRMSLQTFNLAPLSLPVEKLVTTWDYRLFYELAQALNRGVTVEVVLSNPGAVAGKLSQKEALYDGDVAAAVSTRLSDLLVQACYLTASEAADLISRRLFVGSLRFSADEGYPNEQGARTIPFSNHAKTFVVDDRVFYVGSQDPFRSNSAAFGYLVEDAVAAQAYVSGYWEKLWGQSQRTVGQSKDSSLVKSQNAEATLFILDLLDNKRLSKTWQSAIADYVNAATDAKAPFLAILNDIIANAGYETTANAVIELTRTPFFTNTRLENSATDESDRFVKDLLTQKDLLRDFAALIDSIHGDVVSSDAAINQFLSTKKYDCTVLQIYASFAGIRGGNLNYYQGSYAGAAIADGGKAFDFSTGGSLQQRAAGSATPAVQLLPAPRLMVESDQSIKLDGVALLKPRYVDSVLTWSTADGNTTSGSLTFSEVPRPGLLDPFCGVECFGEIEYPAATGALEGKLSFYSRRQSDDKHPTQPDAPVTGPLVWPIVVSVLLGLLLCFTAVGALYRSRDRWNRRDQDDRPNRYAQLIDEVELDNPPDYGRDEAREGIELRRRIVNRDLGAASSDNPDGWAYAALQGEIKQDVDHYARQEGARVDENKLRSSFEQQFSDLVRQSLLDDDFSKESSSVADSLLTPDFMSQVKEIATSTFQDEITQSVTKSLISRMGESGYKKFAADSMGAYLEASIKKSLADPLVSRMSAENSLTGDSYIRSLLTEQVLTLKAEYIKDPRNKSALQSELGQQMTSILGDQKTTAAEKLSAQQDLRQAESNYARTRSATDAQRVDNLANELDALEEKEARLEEERRNAESRGDELDPDKLDEKRKEEKRKADQKGGEVFEV
jgi:predicted esterase